MYVWSTFPDPISKVSPTPLRPETRVAQGFESVGKDLSDAKRVNTRKHMGRVFESSCRQKESKVLERA